MPFRNLSLALGLATALSLFACGDDTKDASDTRPDADTQTDTAFGDTTPADTQPDTSPDTSVDDTQPDTSPDTSADDTQADTSVDDTQADTSFDDTQADTSVDDTQEDTAPDSAPDTADAQPDTSDEPVALRLVTFSDWHGQLDPVNVTVDGTTTPPTTKSVGGAAVLAAYFAEERAEEPHTLVLTAGDAFGGTPPLSAFFDDEPAVDALNLMGLDADTFGNHNFDHGLTYLNHLIERAEYPFVSANLTDLAANLPGVVSPYLVRDVGGVKVALIGLTNPDAPDLTFPGNMGTIEVLDPATQARAARTAAAAEGATVFVLLVHMGATGGTSDAPTGPLVDLAHSLQGFQVIVGDHTDFETQQTINGQLVVENKSKGMTYARIDLTVVPSTGAVTASQVTFVEPVWQTNGPAGPATLITPDAAVDALLAPLREGLSAVNDTVIATAAAVFERDGTKERLQEMPIGNLVCDAFLDRYATQLCFINGGSLRSPLPSAYAPADHALRRPGPDYAPGPPYDIVIGDIYSVQPFGNDCVTRSVTGAQLWAMLEHGLSSLPSKAGFFPQISGFAVVYDVDKPAGSRVVSVKLDGGTAVAADDTQYTLVTSNFVNEGGDGYSMLADGQGTTRELDAAVLQAYVQQIGTLTPTTEGRISENGPVGPADPAVTSVTIAGGSTMDVVAGGGTGVFSVTLASAAPAAGTVVALSSASAAVQVPASVTVPAGATQATFRVKAAGAGAGVTITATTSGGAATGTVNVVLAGVAPTAGAVVLNELNFDPPSDDAATAGALEGDYNCDGVAPGNSEYQDEFVELANTTNKSLVLDGVSLWDANAIGGVTPSYQIGVGVTLGPGEVLVVMGGPVGSVGTSPWCAGASASHIGDARALGLAASPGLALNNGGDDLYLTLTNDPESLLLDGVTWGNGVPAKESQVLDPEVTGTTYNNHSAMPGALPLPWTATPGLHADGRKFADASLP